MKYNSYIFMNRDKFVQLIKDRLAITLFVSDDLVYGDNYVIVNNAIEELINKGVSLSKECSIKPSYCRVNLYLDNIPIANCIKCFKNYLGI